MANKYNFRFKYVLDGRKNKSIMFRFRIFLAERINKILIPKQLSGYSRNEISGNILHGRTVDHYEEQTNDK